MNIIKKVIYVILVVLIVYFSYFNQNVKANILNEHSELSFSSKSSTTVISYDTMKNINSNIDIKYQINAKSFLNYAIIYEYDSENVKIDNVSTILNISQNAIFNLNFSISSNGVYEINVVFSNLEDAFSICAYIVVSNNICFISPYSIEESRIRCNDYLYNNNYINFNQYKNTKNDIETISNTSVNIQYNEIMLCSNDNHSFEVTGVVNWQDTSGNYHPYKYGVVKVYDDNAINGEVLLGSTMTNQDGEYSIIIENDLSQDENGYDIVVKVCSDGNHAVVVNSLCEVYELSNDEIIYNIDTDVSLIKVDFNIDNDRFNSYHSSFQIHQALLMAYDFILDIDDLVMDKILTHYPSTGTNYDATFIYHDYVCINILKDDYCDWDVIQHEYGHYVQDEYNISQSPGGPHTYNNLADARNNKVDGLNLAWGEGWATFFAISLQKYFNGVTLNIPNVGNDIYNDTLDYELNMNIELLKLNNNFIRLGEASELNVSGVLYDFFDNKEETIDNIQYSIQDIWEVVVNNNCTNISMFVNEFFGYDINRDIDIGKILSDSGFSAYNISSSYDNDKNKISINWNAGGGSNIFPNNQFNINFYDKDYSIIYKIENLSFSSYSSFDTPLEYTLNLNHYMEILLNYNGKIYYSIEAYQTSGIRTGGYLSELHEIQLDDILKCITTNQIDANCYTTIQSISDFCSNNNFLLYKVNIECTKSYKIISNSSNSIEICLYDNDMNLLNIVPVMSDNNCTGTIINYLASGTYYLKLAFTELSNSGIITTTYQATWPSTGEQIYYCSSASQNNVLHHLHEIDNNLFLNKCYYINTQGAGFYKFKLNVDNITSYQSGTIKIYTDQERTILLDRFENDVFSYTASSNTNENEMYVFLPSNGTYYIDILLNNINYSSVTLEIEEVEVKDLNYSASLSSPSFNLIFENVNKYNYFEKVIVDATSKVQIDVIANGTLSGYVPILMFKEEVNLQTPVNNREYYLQTVVFGEANSSNYFPTYTVVVDPGTYYIGYILNDEKVFMSIGLTRLVEYSDNMDDVLVADPYYIGYDLGTEVLLNNGNCDNYTITEGFTRNIYLMVEDRLSDPMSRLQYDWYSSNESIATVSNYGTILAMPVETDTTVTIFAVLKEDPSIVYFKTFTILNDEEEDLFEIELEMFYSYSEENGTYQLELTNTNCPYPMIQYYDFEVYEWVQEGEFEVSLNYWGQVTATGPGACVIIGTYRLNPRVRIYINLSITD